MLNKKILAASIAAAFTLNANAAVNLEAAGTTADPVGTVVYASEAIESSDLDGVLLEVSAAGTADLDFSAEVGFTIGNGTSKYLVITLSGDAEFDGTPALTLTNATGAVSQGGDGESSVVIEVAATADIAASAVYTITGTDYKVSSTGMTTVTVATYETAADAVNELNALYTVSNVLTSVVSVVTGDIADPTNAISTVVSEFKAFDTSSDATTVAIAPGGLLDTSEYVDGTSYTPAGALVDAATFLTAAQKVTIAGDFSFGTWTLNTNVDCTTAGSATALVLNADEDEATVAANITDVNAAPIYLCVTVDTTEVINKGSYVLELDTDEVSDTIGTISYDTTSVDVPYLTTFSSYNQRLYIVNNGATDATYTVTFISEDGVTATAGSQATGEVESGTVLSIKASDIVSLSGKTRTAAIVEIEAATGDISVASQSVNLSDGTTDTVVLH